ncbi:NACHT domain-containing protein [Streptomyces sp. Tue6028]|uniref:NACHT domain-containing protein n=1 Tax=Streptomyces sp. Tue6028 TaxID=2036037 RepID=UPI003EBD78EE
MQLGGRRHRRMWQVGMFLCGLITAVCAVWVVNALRHGGLESGDRASVAGLLFGVAGLWAAVAALRQKPWDQPDLAAAADALARHVMRLEEESLYQLRGADFPAIDIAFTTHPQYRPADVRDASGPLQQGQLSKVAAFFRATRPQRLVITGGAGAGKTVLAAELVLTLLEERQDNEPVPVRLSVAGWDTTRPLDEWMVDQLVRDRGFDLHPAVAVALVKHHLVLPVLDGLDEMDAETTPTGQSRARAALAVLNTLPQGRGPAPAVVTCRHDRYADLAAHGHQFRDAAWVSLKPVSHAAALDYLKRRDSDGRWEPVRRKLDTGQAPVLAQALTTPWRLTLAVTAYAEDGDPRALLPLGTTAEIDNYLLARFVPAAGRLHPPSFRRHDADQAHRWLHALATYLAAPPPAAGSVGADLVLHRLWPIAGPRKARCVHAVLASLIVTVAVGVLTCLSLLSPAAPPPAFLAASGAAVCLLGLRRWAQKWPRPRRPVDARRLRTIHASVQAAKSAVAVLLPVALSVGFTIGAERAAAYVAKPDRPDWYWPTALAIAGLAAALSVLAAAAAFTRWLAELADATPDRATTPRKTLTGDLTAGVLTSLAFSLTAGIAASWAMGPWFGLGLALAALAGVVVVADAWMRYIVLLLCTRGLLPWRLAAFMDWASRAGLLRISGTAYQFRHRELQDWLAANPDPAP